MEVSTVLSGFAAGMLISVVTAPVGVSGAVFLLPGRRRHRDAWAQATVTLRGTFDAGAAELTWRHDGKAIAIWDFNIELD